jgi:hypothetical protein
VHDWTEIATAFERIVARLGWPLSRAHLADFRGDLLAEPLGSFAYEALLAECQLSSDSKGDLLARALAIYSKVPLFPHGLARPGGTRTSSPLEALRHACTAFPDQGDPVAGVGTYGELARVVRFDTLKRNLPLRGRYGSYSSAFDGSLWKGLLAKPSMFRNPELLSSLVGRIRGGAEPNLFSTLAAVVDAETHSLSSEQIAAKFRDRLGLPHLEGQEVAELRIPESVARYSGCFRKPTFADAGAYPPFLPSDRGDPTGFARDLSASDPKTPGWPEIWHGDVTAREASGVRFLGIPRPPLSSTNPFFPLAAAASA